MIPLLLVQLIGCGSTPEEEPFVCDTNVYICDTAAWWLRQKEALGTVDRVDGVYLDEITLPGCIDDAWIYQGATFGLTNGANLVNAWESVQAGGYNEEQPLYVASSEGAGDQLLTTLIPGAFPEDVVPGQRTGLSCGTHDVDPVMNYAMRIYDVDGNLADCAVFTTRLAAEAAINELFDNPTEAAPVTARNEINRQNCAVWGTGTK